MLQYLEKIQETEIPERASKPKSVGHANGALYLYFEDGLQYKVVDVAECLTHRELNILAQAVFEKIQKACVYPRRCHASQTT